jgi:hypothetical protein
MMRSILRQPIERLFYFSLVLIGLVYVFNSWSPSSYGVFLQNIEPNHTGIILGKPRAIRSDEWAVVTPLTQATVNNHFERYNQTSFYNEDLRINYGLPIFDWGMFFKPTMWGYLFLSPAKAYSLQWFLTFVLFVVGYFKLFKQMGIREELAIFLSFSLFYTGATQFWWNEKGPVYAFFPVITYLLISNGNIYIRMIMFYWLGASWLITNFYPPLVISLAFIAALLFIANIKPWLSVKNLALLLVSSIGAILTAILYLKDYLINTSKTIYPGHRSFGGGGVNWGEWLSQIFPFSSFNTHFETIYNGNISEVGVMGFPFLLMLLVHIDYSSLKKIEFDKNKKTLIALGVGLLLTNIWMIVPLPDWVGKILLWNNVNPKRMVYAAGVLLGMVSILVLQDLKYSLSIKRFIAFFLIVILMWYVMKFNPLVPSVADPKSFSGFKHNYSDFYILVSLLVSYFLVSCFSIKIINAFVFTSLISSFVVLFPFNPIQSADAIFSRHDNIKKILDESVDEKTGVLAIDGYPGATLNGLGYKSVTHVTAVPAMNLWRSKFPNMPQEEFDEVFNRYSHVHLANVVKPFSPQHDVVVVPISLFNKVEYYPENEENQASLVNLFDGIEINGIAMAGKNGEINSFSPLVGTYYGKSDGYLELMVCAEGQCEEVSVFLKNKADNQYALMRLKLPLKVMKGDLINYKFSLRNATQPLALWSARSDKGMTVSSDNKIEKKQLSVKLELNYVSE